MGNNESHNDSTNPKQFEKNQLVTQQPQRNLDDLISYYGNDYIANSGLIDENKLLGSKSLNHYWDKMKKPNGAPWCKDMKVGYQIGGDYAYDDYFKLSRLSGGLQGSKVSKLRVWLQHEGGYVSGVQFIYSPVNQPEQLIEGFVVRDRQRKANRKEVVKEFKLEKNEYIIECVGRKGMIIDNFGVRTSSGNLYGFGGTGGGAYSTRAPDGFHFTCFSALYNPGWNSISQFSSEIFRIPQQQKSEMSSTSPGKDRDITKEYKPIFRYVIKFLTLSETLKLFRLNNTFASLRYDDFVLSYIRKQCVSSNDPKRMKYLSKVIKHLPKNLQESQNGMIENFTRHSKNLILNPNGERQFEGYDESLTHSGSGISIGKSESECYFQFSFDWGSLRWKSTFQKLFESDEYCQEQIIDKIQNRQYGLIFGANIAESGFGSIAKLELIVRDQYQQVIFTQEETLSKLTREFKFYSLKFINPNPGVTPHNIQCTVLGKDTCYWAGNYGAKVNNISLNIIPIDDDEQNN